MSNIVNGILPGINIIRSYTNEYNRVLEYAVSKNYSLPSVNVREKQNLYVKRLVNSELWNRKVLIYVFANDCIDEKFALINWKDPTKYLATKLTTVVWYKNKGLSGPLNSTWLPDANSESIYFPGNMHIYCHDGVTAIDGLPYGVLGNALAERLWRYPKAGATPNIAIHGLAQTTMTYKAFPCSFTDRRLSTAITLFQNETQYFSSTQAVNTSLDNRPLYINGRNNQGVLDSTSDIALSTFQTGGYINDTLVVLNERFYKDYYNSLVR